MRRLITCFVIVCLTLTSGAPTDEHSTVRSNNSDYHGKEAIFSGEASDAPAEGESKAHIKRYSFNHGEVINSLNPFWNDEITYAVCDGSDADKKCKVYVESTSQENNSTLSCDLSLKYTGSFSDNVLLTHAGNSKVILTVRGGEAQIKLISVDMKSCRHNESNFDVPKDSLPKFGYLFNFYVLPHEKNYELFFRSRELCPGYFCKATLDYEGKVVKAASIFPMRDLEIGFYKIESSNNGYLAFQSALDGVNAYFIENEGKHNNITLFTGPIGGYFHGLSTAENKLGFCALNDRDKMACKQYDTDSKIKKIETELSIAITQNSYTFRTFDVLNLKKGFLALVSGYAMRRGKIIISIAYVDEQGKQVKSINVDPKCIDVPLTKLYRNSDGQYCLNAVCMKLYDNSNRSKFSTASRCFLKKELF